MTLTVRVRRAVSMAVIGAATLAILTVAYVGAFQPARMSTALGLSIDLCALIAVAGARVYLHNTRKRP